MKSLFIYRNIFLVLLAVIMIVSANLVYLFTAGYALIQQPAGSVTPTANVPDNSIAELHSSQPCSSKQRYFQMGVAFPQWSPTGYGTADTKWLTELQDMRIFISEIGYRNSADALYRSWEPTSPAPADPQEQAAACDAALANIIPDQHILGSFFWGWDDVEAFNLNGLQATNVIHKYYESLQA